jgi:hypothetical protein
MENVNIAQRLLSTLIDKALILVLFVMVILCISPYGMLFKLGSYYALLDERPSSYHFQDESLAMRHVYGDKVVNSSYDKWVQYAKEIQNHPDLVKPFEGETLSWDLKITGLFIVVNCGYYLLFELLFHASFGKFLCGLVVVSKDFKKSSEKEKIKRSCLLLLLMICAVGLRFAFNTNYYVTIFLFFGAVDIFVFIKGRSLIDMITNTYIVKKKSIVDKI